MVIPLVGDARVRPAGASIPVASRIAEYLPAAGSVLLTWLGQAGFMLKSSNGTTVLIDPYLSDAAEHSHALRRVAAPPITADRIDPDIVLITHSHVDHLDPPTVREWGRRAHATLIAPPPTVQIAQRQLDWRGPCIELPAGESASLDGVRATATWARHGYDDPPPDGAQAVGFLLEIDGLALWHAGDTEYDARLHRASPGQIDVAFVPINGSGGNMNAHEAALLAWQLRVKLAVPMHFGLWSNEDYSYGGEEPWATPVPEQFVATYASLAPQAAVKVPVLGEVIVVGAGGALISIV